MRDGNPEATDRQCVSCNSYQITERRKVDGIMVKLFLRCAACRQEMLFWTGSITEERKFKRARRQNKRRLSG